MKQTCTRNSSGLSPVKGTSYPQQYKVRGNYMAPKLVDGDYVRVNASSPITNGDMCVIKVKRKYILRRYYITGRDTVELRVDNPASKIKAKCLKNHEYLVVGKVGAHIHMFRLGRYVWQRGRFLLFDYPTHIFTVVKYSKASPALPPGTELVFHTSYLVGIPTECIFVVVCRSGIA